MAPRLHSLDITIDSGARRCSSTLFTRCFGHHSRHLYTHSRGHFTVSGSAPGCAVRVLGVSSTLQRTCPNGANPGSNGSALPPLVHPLTLPMAGNAKDRRTLSKCWAAVGDKHRLAMDIMLAIFKQEPMLRHVFGHSSAMSRVCGAATGARPQPAASKCAGAILMADPAFKKHASALATFLDGIIRRVISSEGQLAAADARALGAQHAAILFSRCPVVKAHWWSVFAAAIFDALLPYVAPRGARALIVWHMFVSRLCELVALGFVAGHYERRMQFLLQQHHQLHHGAAKPHRSHAALLSCHVQAAGCSGVMGVAAAHIDRMPTIYEMQSESHHITRSYQTQVGSEPSTSVGGGRGKDRSIDVAAWQLRTVDRERAGLTQGQGAQWAPPPGAHAHRVQFAYSRRQPDELSLSAGDIVHVVEKCDDGWYIGTTASGDFGTFPGNYVTPV